MASIKLTGDTSGEITISAPAVAGTNTLTLPANTGNIVTTGDSGTITQGMIASGVASTGPAFSAYLTSQSVSNNTWTKMECDTEEFDTNSNYDNATNYRFTPTVAGYYQVSGQAFFSVSTGRVSVRIYKNGSAAREGAMPSNAGGTETSMCPSVSALMYMNGTTDYIELYAWQNGGNTETISGNSGIDCYFQAVLVRAA